MPILTVELFAGRTVEKKRELAKALTDAYVGVLGGNPKGITIILQDVPKENWAIGGELCSDLYPDPPKE